MIRTPLAPGAIAIATIAADYGVKRWIEQTFELHRVFDVLPFLAIYRTNNTGIAFSMLDWLDERWLIAVPGLVVIFVGWLAWRTDPAHHLARFGFALIIGGAIGNLIDRITLGHVVDYVLFHVGNWSFAIFNLADAAITVGAVFVLCQELLNWKHSA